MAQTSGIRYAIGLIAMCTAIIAPVMFESWGIIIGGALCIIALNAFSRP